MATVEDLGFKPPTRLFTRRTTDGAPSVLLVLLDELAAHVADGPHGTAPRPRSEALEAVAAWLGGRAGFAFYLHGVGTEYGEPVADSTELCPAQLVPRVHWPAVPVASDDDNGGPPSAQFKAMVREHKKRAHPNGAPARRLPTVELELVPAYCGPADALRFLVDRARAAGPLHPMAARLAICEGLAAEVLAELCPPPAQAATLVAIHDAKKPAPARAGRLSEEQAEALRDWAAAWKRANPGDAPGRAQALMKAWPRVFPGRPKSTRQAVEKLLAHHVDTPRSAPDFLKAWCGNSTRVAPKVAGSKVKNAQRASR